MNNKDYIQIKVRIRLIHEPELAQYFSNIPPQWRAETVRRVLLAALSRGMLPTLTLEPLQNPANLEKSTRANTGVKIDNSALERMARLNRFE